DSRISFGDKRVDLWYPSCLNKGEESSPRATILPPQSKLHLLRGYHVQLLSTCPEGLYAHRAADRGRHHRHLGRDRDPEVRQHEVEGVRHRYEVRPSQPRDG